MFFELDVTKALATGTFSNSWWFGVAKSRTNGFNMFETHTASATWTCSNSMLPEQKPQQHFQNQCDHNLSHKHICQADVTRKVARILHVDANTARALASEHASCRLTADLQFKFTLHPHGQNLPQRYWQRFEGYIAVRTVWTTNQTEEMLHVSCNHETEANHRSECVSNYTLHLKRSIIWICIQIRRMPIHNGNAKTKTAVRLCHTGSWSANHSQILTCVGRDKMTSIRKPNKRMRPPTACGPDSNTKVCVCVCAWWHNICVALKHTANELNNNASACKHKPDVMSTMTPPSPHVKPPQ